jgi:GTP:adenosylcobinamide-phosphate guanylyltransferase
MKYVIMAGGNYPKWELPKQFSKIRGEVIIERTIRLLKENGVTDIAISTNDERFNDLGVEILNNPRNNFEQCGDKETKESSHSWLNAYCPVDEEVCYLHGDVYFSDEAIKTIVETEVEDTMFFCAPDKRDVPNKDIRNPKGREPLAYKVKNYKKFRKAVDELLEMIDNGEFSQAKCKPISWTVYRYLNGLDIAKQAQGYGALNSIFHTNGDYIIINDYTTDVDKPEDVERIEKQLKFEGGIMVREEALMDFRLGAFKELRNIKRIDPTRNEDGKLYKGDTFECDEAMAKYLDRNNPTQLELARIIEYIPKEEKKVEEKPKKKPIIRRTKK